MLLDHGTGTAKLAKKVFSHTTGRRETSGGSAFHARETVTAKVQSLSVRCRVAGNTTEKDQPATTLVMLTDMVRPLSIQISRSRTTDDGNE